MRRGMTYRIGIGVVGNEFNDNVTHWVTASEYDFTSQNDKHSFYSSYQYEYVVIDGRPYGKTPAI